MDHLTGRWISGDGFGLKLQSTIGGRIEGEYQTYLPDSKILLAFEGVGLRQNGSLMFAATVECSQSAALGRPCEITVHGTVDEYRCIMRLRWLATSASGQAPSRAKSIRGTALLLRLPHGFSWDPGFSSELFAPHTLLVGVNTASNQSTLAGPTPALAPPSKRKKS